MQNMKRMKANQAHKWPVPERIELLYRTMADALGPTGWWPAETTFEIMVGKPVPAALALLPDAPQEPPYPGAKPMLLVEEVDDGAFLRELLVAMEPERLQELIRPSGFYVNKSKTVQSLSWWYVERCGIKCPWPSGRRAWQRCNGVSP